MVVRGPHSAAAEMLPDVMRIEPNPVQAGDLASVFFLDERGRGVHYVLESEKSDGWELEYHLVSDWRGQPIFVDADDPNIFAVEDIGFEGPGPDGIVIPPDTPAGSYRVCTGNSRPNICAPITVDG